MSLKWLGAVLIILSCGGLGFSMAASHVLQEKHIHGLINALDYMESELRYRLTPLPELCLAAGNLVKGSVGDVFLKLSLCLEQENFPDVQASMVSVLAQSSLDGTIRILLGTLGETLGRFDLEGQLCGLNSVKADCQRTLEELSRNRESRLRSYQTLGLCAGAALAILLI